MFLTELINNSKKALKGSETVFYFKGDGGKSIESSSYKKTSQLKKTKHNCLQCRKARTKCNRGVPSCSRCLRLGYECVAVDVKRGRMYIPFIEYIPLE